MPRGVSSDRWIHFDYEYLLPALARLPLGAGQKLIWLRGLLYAALDHDWRNHATGFRYVRLHTRQAMDIMLPHASPTRRMYKTVLRYGHHSREEWQACLFHHEIMQHIHRHSTVEHLATLQGCHKQGRGVVMVSCHLDSFCLGMVLMGMHGLPVNVINTIMIEDPHIHPAVRRFFQNKYRAMESRMHGRMPYYQTEMSYFDQVLKAGQMVVLMGDIPGTKSDCCIDWLGKPFRLPLGAWHMARRSNSLIAAFVCIQEGPGRYRVVVLPPVEIDPRSPRNTLLPLYNFMADWIKRYPERWISSDLLPSYAPPP